MEEVFKFLLVAAFIVIGLVRQFKKDAGNNAGENPGMPVPNADMSLPDANEDSGTLAPGADAPLPKYREDSTYGQRGGNTHGHRGENIYGGYIPESPPRMKKPKPAYRNYAPPKNKRNCGKASPPPSASLPQESDETTPEYGIHSAEEARRAIIWAEILQRKY